MPVTLICPICKQTFQCKPSHVKVRTYCSKECMSKVYNKRIKKTCQICGNSFYVPNNKHRKDAKYCSKKCMGEGMSGENHSMWKGGLRTNREYQRAVKKKNYPRYREKALHYAKKRKLRMKEIPGSHTREEWEQLLAGYEGKCAYCGKVMVEELGPDQVTRDHVIPVSKGGTDNIDNIVPACRACNSSKNDRLDYEIPLAL